ncbi:MAG: hypothetical protein AAFY56_01740 [Pseudomonadota bacterium]
MDLDVETRREAHFFDKDENQYDYLVSKIKNADFLSDPFPHLLIEDFLSDDHLELLLSDTQVQRPPVETTEDLISDLLEVGYNVQPFPGCTTSVQEYLDCFNKNSWPVDEGYLEGFGLTFRLKNFWSDEVRKLIDFLNSKPFHDALKDKFAIKRPNRVETAIHKYLSGYEISPHPDLRAKCLTYLLNINTTPSAKDIDIHTHLLKFKPSKEYIYNFWEHNPEFDTSWVPWDWCETTKKIADNNTIVLFAPSNRTLHAVKLRYDHRAFQRTQIYGNLWYDDAPKLLPQPHYRDLEVRISEENRDRRQIAKSRGTPKPEAKPKKAARWFKFR